MAKVAIAGGHSKACPGASGYLDEYTENRRIKDVLVAEMKKRGHEVTDCSNEQATQMAEMQREVITANDANADIFCAIHLNAYQDTAGERGVEVWYWSGDAMGQKVASKMASNLAALMGLPNRGAKATTELYVIANTNMTAVLPEVCFVDAKGDADKYRSVSTEAIAAAMADAIEAGVGTVKVEAPKVEEPKEEPKQEPVRECECMELLREIREILGDVEADVAELRGVLDAVRGVLK